MTRGARQNQGFSAVRRSLSSETMRRTTAGLVFFLVCMQTGISTAKLAPKAFPSSSAFLSTTTTQVATPFATTHVSRLNPRKVAYERIWSFSRGGAEESDADSEEGEEEGADETDEENEEESEAESEGEESEPEDEEIDEVQIEMSVEKYDEPLVASPMLNLYASLAVMMLARKVDLFSPKLVKIAR